MHPDWWCSLTVGGLREFAVLPREEEWCVCVFASIIIILIIVFVCVSLI